MVQARSGAIETEAADTLLLKVNQIGTLTEAAEAHALARSAGWRVTISALAHERSGISEVEGLRRHLEALKELARLCQKGGRPASEDPGVRRRIASASSFIGSASAARPSELRTLARLFRLSATSGWSPL